MKVLRRRCRNNGRDFKSTTSEVDKLFEPADARFAKMNDDCVKLSKVAL